MLDKIIYYICRPMVIIVVLSLAVLSVVVFAVSNAMYQSDSTLVSNLQIDTVEQDSDSGKLVATLVDYEKKQEQEYKSISTKLSDAANPEKSVTDKIDKYINARYNFENGVSAAKAELQSEMKSYATPDFINAVNSSLDNEKMTSSKATIVKRFISGRSMEMLNSSVDTLVYLYVVDINGQQFLIQYECKLNQGEWMIFSEKVLKSLQDGEKFV